MSYWFIFAMGLGIGWLACDAIDTHHETEDTEHDQT